jgi:hypothetical protein
MIIYAMMMRSSGDDEEKKKEKGGPKFFYYDGVSVDPQEVWHQVSGMRYGTKERELYKIQF